MNEVEEVTNVQHVAGMISGTATATSSAVVKTISYRIPVYLLASIDAMSVKSKKSRNAMLNLVLQAGIDEVRKQLSEDVAVSLMIEEARAMQELFDGSTESNEE